MVVLEPFHPSWISRMCVCPFVKLIVGSCKVDDSDQKKVHVVPHFPVFCITRAQHVRNRCKKREGDETRVSPCDYEIPTCERCWVNVMLSECDVNTLYDE